MNSAYIYSCMVVSFYFYSCYFYSASTSPLLLRGAPKTARILCRSFTPKRHGQLRVKNLPDVAAREGFQPKTNAGNFFVRSHKESIVRRPVFERQFVICRLLSKLNLIQTFIKNLMHL